ncbi:AAA family ATPase [Hazenella sp. IB182357]|uniref:AAA family ATPase n=1 Tax=Polycladospora coralii TaxID=2771432 RepID=A0A926NHV2_9BACL|nr:AAA family ATPase [Polycladospora coralii]MBS7531936.1 AAA family ATPase [Polycladospora coralii]
MFLKSIHSRYPDQSKKSRDYPFSIPTIYSFEDLEIHSPVTFFVGENGSGKSTLLEAIADQCRFNTAGGSQNHQFDLQKSESALGPYIKLSWMPKINQGFFLRAESFYHYATYIDQLRADDPSFQPYDFSLHERSHGESFLALSEKEFYKKGVYLLDEPEAALSPSRQLAFIKILHHAITHFQAQFIIATHSPILLGFPEAQIINFDTVPISPVRYEDTNHYAITKYFLSNKSQMLTELLKDE